MDILNKWFALSSGNAYKVSTNEWAYKQVIKDFIDAGYIFEGLDFGTDGLISHLYFRKET